MIRVHCTALFTLCVLSAQMCQAVDKDWNLAGNGNWSTALNWAPNGTPGTTDDVYLGRGAFPQGFLTTLDLNATIGSLTIRNGSDLNTNGFQLIVNGLTTVGGTGTVLTIEPKSTSDFDGLDTQGLLIQNDGLVSLAGGILELESGSLDIATGGTSGAGGLGGFGTIELIQSTGGTQVFNNSGRLFVSKSLFAVAGTLTITNKDTETPATVGDGTVDLDGDTETGIVDVDSSELNSNLTLVVDAELSDGFNSEMMIGLGDAVDMRRAWTLSGGTLQMNGSNGTATLRGSTVTINNNGVLNVNSGTAAIDSGLTLTSGAIHLLPNTTLRLGGTATINDAEAIDHTDTAVLQITGNTTINDATGDFDWDAGGSASTRITGNGRLTIDVGNVEAVSGDQFNGQIDLEDNAFLTVHVADDEWEIGSNGELNKNGVGTALLSGSRLVLAGGALYANAGTLDVDAELQVGFGGLLSVDTGATVRLDGDHQFLAGGLVTVDGNLTLNGATTMAGPALFSGSGTVINEGSLTVTQNTTINVNTFDWDEGNTTLQTGRNLTLNVDKVDQGNDTYNTATTTVKSGTLTVNVVDDEWNLGTGGAVILENVNGTTPSLAGDRVRLTDTGQIRATGGDARIDAPVTLDSGSEILVETPLTLQLHGATTLNGGSIRETATSTVGQFGPVTVTGNSSINVSTYNWDQAATTIEPGGTLTLNVGALDVQAGERYDNQLTINSGNLVVHNTLNQWTMDDRLFLNNTNGTFPRISGEPLHIGDGVSFGDAKVRVGGTGVSAFDSAVTYLSDADTVVNAGAILRHNDPVTFLGGGTYGGAGTLDFASAITVSGATTINMPSGTVDLDGPANDVAGNNHTLVAPLTIQAASLSPFGKSNVSGINAISVDKSLGGSLTVALTNPTDSWMINAPGQLNLINGNAPATVLAGSDLMMNGELNVFGDVIVTARMNLGGDTTIASVGEPLRLEGGSVSTPNRLVGGNINGLGFLSATAGHALHGFGAIQTPLLFEGNSELKADDGELVVSGIVSDVGEIGTADVDGTLNMTNAWNTNVATNVRMAGGFVTGAAITNDGLNGIAGFGSVTARVTNNSLVRANGGTLVLNHANTDYDGAANTGVLDALTGRLELRDNSVEQFSGTAKIGAGQSGFANGFRFNFANASTLQLTEATWQSTHGTNLAGTIVVSGTGASTLDLDGDATFVGGSNTTLGANLRLANAPTLIQVGASFSGGGDLVNLSGSTLRLENGAVVAVGVQNQGIVQIAAGTTSGRSDVSDFIQSSTGNLVMDLAGTALTQFDRLVMTGGAQLDGALDVGLQGGFVPALGNTFTILSAAGGVTGTFASENLPLLGSGLAFDVIYSNTNVMLEVIRGISPDFDMDGDVDGADVDLLVMEIVGMTNGPLFDLTGDGNVNNADLTEWLGQAGSINLPSGNSYIYGDANLDGVVDGSDFGTWNANKFTLAARWTLGDFTADGVVDGSDFGTWNANKFTSATLSVVPEPGAVVTSLCGIVLLILARRMTNRIVPSGNAAE